MFSLVSRFLTACLLLLALPAMAQFRVEVTGVGMTQMPIVVAPFKGEGAAPQKIAAIVQADLERSGQFKGLDASGAAIDELSRPDWSAWRQRNADALVGGSVTRLADGRYDIRARLWDVVKGQDKSEFRDTVVAADLRQAAHRLADWVYQQLTGTPGAFASRIVYVTKAGGRYTLWVADSDGEGAQAALASPEPIISPTWSPSGQQLAYVSFESRKPVVYVHEITTGRRAPRFRSHAPSTRRISLTSSAALTGSSCQRAALLCRATSGRSISSSAYAPPHAQRPPRGRRWGRS